MRPDPLRPHRRTRRPVRRPGAGVDRATEVALGGRRATVEAIRAGRALRIMVSTEARSTQGLDEVMHQAAERGVPVRRVTRAELSRLGPEDHQGVVAVVSLPPELGERDLAITDFPDDAIVVILDGVTDPQNLGAAGRSAEAAGVSLLIARTRRAAPLTPSAVRASAGALLHLPVARVTNLARAIGDLKDRGFFVVGLDHRANADIHSAPPPPRPVALVVGAEDRGISRLVREACDLLVAIPVGGRTATLNASSALAVGLFGYALRPHP